MHAALFFRQGSRYSFMSLLDIWRSYIPLVGGIVTGSTKKKIKVDKYKLKGKYRRHCRAFIELEIYNKSSSSL